ncbi:MAG: DUF2961 domain-containing protein [bacterium]|nr:DUF2961 domain-containing protein [bacterium]
MARSLPCLLLLGSLVSASAIHAQAPPWETWQDLRRLSELHPGHQALLRSSHCPDGCRFDRHSAGDWRYVYVDGEEGVIFEEAGAGAITRIWMTTGSGISEPLDPAIQLRVYVDGAAEPVVDIPLPALFDGSTPPFEPPLVGDRLTSSGGFFSYVPIPYREGCRVVLVGADDKKLWFQINFQRLSEAGEVQTFTGMEDLSAFADRLSNRGQDPWPAGSGGWREDTVTLDPGVERRIWETEGLGTVTGLEIRADPALWPAIAVGLTFDGQAAVTMPLADFFALGRLGPVPTCSLLLGLAESGFAYSYFPMPFFEGAELSLVHHGAQAAQVDVRVRLDGTPPSPASGLFGAELSHAAATTVGVDFPVVTLEGRGRVAGTFLELGAVGNPFREYVEGDERMFIDRSPHPAVYGTGVEDQFNGGFGFDLGPFARALHGAPYTELVVEGEPHTAAYRLMLTDGITFENHLVVGLEAGPTNNISMRARAVTYFYRQRRAGLELWDRLDLGNAANRARHSYLVTGEHDFRPLDALFEGEPPAGASGTGVYRPPGTASFVLRAHPESTLFRLRRRLDAGVAGQRATILVGGEPAGRFPVVDVNDARRWREIDVDLDVDLRPGVTAGDELALTVVAESGPGDGSQPEFTAFRYELWADGPAAIFADGFESGDLAAWVSQSAETAISSPRRSPAPAP